MTEDNNSISNELEELRDNISILDERLFALFYRRMALAEQVAKYKSGTHTPVLDPQREKELIEKVRSNAPHGLANYAEDLMRTLMRLSRQRQHEIINGE